jgi:hypothetical protein
MTRDPDPESAIDWSLTTWEGARREQLRRWAALPLDRVIAALEEMETLAEALRPPSRDPAHERLDAGAHSPSGRGPG